MSPAMVGKPWTILSRKSLYRGPRGIEVAVESVALPSGRVIDDYFRIEKPDSVVVAALTAEGAFVALRHYLHGPRAVGLTLPGGGIEGDEPPLEAARRELLEETGYTAARWRPLGTFTRDANQGYGGEHFFLAEDARRVAEPDSGDLEEAEVLLLTPDRIRAALARGEVPIVGHAAAIGLALLALAPPPSA